MVAVKYWVKLWRKPNYCNLSGNDNNNKKNYHKTNQIA